ncbi:MFS transporter [Bacillus tianshenii]|nr:MFS transporter [Bacillus tianshenii]
MNNQSTQTQVGVKENIAQFVLLVVINLFVGSMVGLERTILPIIGEERFGLASISAALSFIVSFGFSKAIMNFFTGSLADRMGRKQVLLIGWAVGLFVPILVIFAHVWWVIVVANILLGINQALTWSMTVNMKVDLAKSTQRGLAVGFNEFAGYTGVAVMAAVSGYVASTYSLSPEPFYIGIVLVIIGFILSWRKKRAYSERVAGWPEEALSNYIATMHEARPFMPPFVGTEEERDALAHFITKSVAKSES